MNECIFCKIARGELPCYKIDENAEHLAFMDIFPPTFDGKITMPTVLVASKKHLSSNIFEDLSEKEYERLLMFTRRIAKATQQGLKPNRVCLVLEGLEIDHIHPKLYPVFLESYPGYLSTKKGPENEDQRASDAFLTNTAAKIAKALPSDIGHQP